MHDILESFAARLVPPPIVKWYEWAADGGIILPSRVATPKKGSYNVRFTPALLRAADALDDPDVSMVVIKKGTQGGGTQMGFAWLASKTVLDPEQSAVVLATVDLARQRSKNTFKPMIEASERVAAELVDHRDSLSNLEYNFKGCMIYWFGGNSAAGLSSNPMVRLHISEENKYGLDEKEGNSVELAVERTKNFPQSKILRECTPTVAGFGISKGYDSGTQEKMHVPCPHCGHRAVMGWRDKSQGHWVQFDDSLPIGLAAESARYVCQSCESEWNDSQRWDAIDAASRLDNFGYIGKKSARESGGIVSIHYPSSLSPMVKVADMVKKFLRVKDTPSELRTFINGWLGEDWIPDVIQASDEFLTACRTTYQLSEKPAATTPEDSKEIAEATAGKGHLTMVTVDVQKGGCWFVVRRWWEGGISALLQFGFVATFDEVEAVATAWHNRSVAETAKDIEAKRTPPMRRLMVWADCGDGNRVDHMEACLRFGWVATFGAAHSFPGFVRETSRELDSGKRKADSPSSVACLELNVSAGKMNLMDKFRGEDCKSARWFIAANSPELYGKQVTAERYNPEKDAWEKRPGQKDNHLFDCEVMSYIAAWMNGFNQTLAR